MMGNALVMGIIERIGNEIEKIVEKKIKYLKSGKIKVIKG